MASGPPSSSLPPSMGPGARPMTPGEQDPKNLLREINEIRSDYNVHVDNDSVRISYKLKGQERSYRIPFDNMPVAGWTKSVTYGGANSSLISGTLLIDVIRGVENTSGRQPSQQEAEGIAYYTARRTMTQYLGSISAIGIGAVAAWSGRKTMKFPFMKPKPLERYEYFPAKFVPILRGGFARAAWQITRVNTYVFMWMFATGVFFRSIADTRMTVGLYNDPRTKDIISQIKGRMDRLRSNRETASSPILQGLEQSQQDGQQNNDDGSPQASFSNDNSYANKADNFSADNSFTDGNTDTGLLSDSQMRTRDNEETSPNSWSRAQSRATTREQPRKSSSSDFFFDDASPTAGNNPDMATSAPYSRRPQQSSSSGSAWDRVRGDSGQSISTQSSRYSSSGPDSERPQDFETKQDSFSFNSNQEDRQLAKQQAQRDFDAMLERERRKGGSEDYQKDMRATEMGSEESSATTGSSAWGRRR